ncbi:MAG: hypothetical protein LBU87_06710 [Lactobacillales bacterium]|nr:hypothetical protein [Lactobacillales bacterium]
MTVNGKEYNDVQSVVQYNDLLLARTNETILIFDSSSIDQGRPLPIINFHSSTVFGALVSNYIVASTAGDVVVIESKRPEGKKRRVNVTAKEIDFLCKKGSEDMDKRPFRLFVFENGSESFIFKLDALEKLNADGKIPLIKHSQFTGTVTHAVYLDDFAKIGYDYEHGSKKKSVWVDADYMSAWDSNASDMPLKYNNYFYELVKDGFPRKKMLCSLKDNHTLVQNYKHSDWFENGDAVTITPKKKPDVIKTYTMDKDKDIEIIPNTELTERYFKIENSRKKWKLGFIALVLSILTYSLWPKKANTDNTSENAPANENKKVSEVQKITTKSIFHTAQTQGHPAAKKIIAANPIRMGHGSKTRS